MSSPSLQSYNKIAAAKELNNFLLRMDEELRAQREASEFRSSNCGGSKAVVPALRVPDEESMMARSTIALRPLRNNNNTSLATTTGHKICPSCAKRSMETPGKNEEEFSACTCDELNNRTPSCTDLSSFNREIMTPDNFPRRTIIKPVPLFSFEEKTSTIEEVPTILPASQKLTQPEPHPPAPLLEMMDCDEDEEMIPSSRIQLRPKVHRASRNSSPLSSPENTTTDYDPVVANVQSLPIPSLQLPIRTPNKLERKRLPPRTAYLESTPWTPAVP
eukprot:CAMPEP_0194207412 /NCGR_PEP_ID=MMETSP0156-20130528/6165_1 /TAXON_ID=33649 /ORGANISM="Thalassionema nitzschioides, Strain L26-B" /LENGTH=274 /DNA_ID=CAMNT_0038934173 /DNA_START=168 /DNA_END=995 /DNA_ORIENTATION=-